MKVLQSLQTLIASNEANRQRLRADIGYDTLQSGLLRHAPPSGPSQLLLEAVLGLILEASPFAVHAQRGVADFSTSAVLLGISP